MHRNNPKPKSGGLPASQAQTRRADRRTIRFCSNCNGEGKSRVNRSATATMSLPTANQIALELYVPKLAASKSLPVARYFRTEVLFHAHYGPHFIQSSHYALLTASDINSASVLVRLSVCKCGFCLGSASTASRPCPNDCLAALGSLYRRLPGPGGPLTNQITAI